MCIFAVGKTAGGVAEIKVQNHLSAKT